MSSISSFDIISVVLCEAASNRWPDPKTFWCIPASYADAAAVNPNGIKTLLVNGLIIFSINGSPVFNNGPRVLPRNPPDYIWKISLIIRITNHESYLIIVLTLFRIGGIRQPPFPLPVYQFFLCNFCKRRIYPKKPSDL